ncbi:MAG: hypothetical protein H7329_07230 [Opitutaceae bacterium]|nr:hypothetical protein [Cytophagales bacterium]
MNIKPFLISLSVILSLNEIQAKTLANDSLIYQSDINGDGFPDKVSTLDKNFNFTIQISNSKKSFINYKYNLKKCYSGIIDLVEPSTFSLEKLKTNFKFKVKLKPDFLKERTLNVTYKDGDEPFKLFGFYDTTKDKLDPDNMEITDYHAFQTSHDINTLQSPLIDLSFNSFNSASFSSNRKAKDYCLDLKNGITRPYPADRIKYFLEKEPVDEANVISYNDIGYYLEQKKLFMEAGYVLVKVLEKFPQRTVAYLNLGDVLWNLNEQEKAAEYYKKYIELMKKVGKEAKIPSKVTEREKKYQNAQQVTEQPVYDTTAVGVRYTYNKKSVEILRKIRDANPESNLNNPWDFSGEYFEGVETNEEGDIIKLSIIGMEIENLPAEIGQLVYLEELIVSQNKLTSLPAQLSQLKNLNTLDLSKNNFTVLPESITQLAKLYRLRASDNNLKTFLKYIARLEILLELDLSGNFFTEIPMEIIHHSNVRTLKMNSNRIKAIPKEIETNKGITFLELNSNNLSEVPKEILKSMVTKLSVQKNNIKHIPVELCNKTIKLLDIVKDDDAECK